MPVPCSSALPAPPRPRPHSSPPLRRIHPLSLARKAAELLVSHAHSHVLAFPRLHWDTRHSAVASANRFQGKLGLFIALGLIFEPCCGLLVRCRQKARRSMHTTTGDQLTRHLPEDLGPGEEVVGVLPVIHRCRNNHVAFDAMVQQ